MSAATAMAIPPAVTHIVGDGLWYHADMPLDMRELVKSLEFPEMGALVANLLRENAVPLPIQFGSQLKMALPNRGVKQGMMGRDHNITFRSKRMLYGKPWYDTILYNYQMPDREGQGAVEIDGLGYGRCVCFLEDGNGCHYVILRCYNPYIREVACGGRPPRGHVPDTMDRETQLVPLHLAKVGLATSYMLVAEEAIINGGFILEDPQVENKHWVVQGHREGLVFQKIAARTQP